MIKAKKGDSVTVHYKAKTNAAIIFDSLAKKEPLHLTIGKQETIPAFENALIGMSCGESKTVKIPAGEAFGPYLPELITTIERKKLPPSHNQWKIGQQLQIQQPDGSSIVVIVAKISESHITFDANHPLAGKDLTFDIEIIKID